MMDPGTHASLNKIKRFLAKYNLTIFLVIATMGVATGIYSLISLVQSSSTVQESSSTTTPSIDEAAIKQIRENTNDTNADTNLPTNQRINLFAE